MDVAIRAECSRVDQAGNEAYGVSEPHNILRSAITMHKSVKKQCMSHRVQGKDTIQNSY